MPTRPARLAGDVPPLQASLLDSDEVPGFDPQFHGAVRTELADQAWVELVPGWATGSDTLFEAVRDAGRWKTREMVMYDDVVTQPRLHTVWGSRGVPGSLAVLRAMSDALSQRYGTPLVRVSANLYRDGRDSVAWHGDRPARFLPKAVVACLSLGHRRPFRLRPVGGGTSLRFDVGRGDLLVMGGSCQRTWQHCVPKVRDAGPRICVMFREGNGVEDDTAHDAEVAPPNPLAAGLRELGL